MVACVIFAFPLFTIVYQAITGLNAGIGLIENEQYGVQYHSQLINLLQRAQEVQELAYAIRSGDKTFSGMLQSKQEELRHTIAAVDGVDKSYGDSLAVGQGWQNIKKSILPSLETQNLQQPIKESSQYPETISSLMNFMGDVADNSNMTNDPQLDSDYLADILTGIMPGFMQTLGRMRALTTGLLASGRTPPQWSEKELMELEVLYDKLIFQDGNLKNDLIRASRANEKSGRFLEYHDQVIEPSLENLQKHFKQMIYAHKNDLSALDAFILATGTLTLYDALYDKTSDSFLNLLNQRQKEYTLKKNMLLYSSTAAFLGFIVLFTFLYRTLTKTERAEQTAVVANQAKSEFLANTSHELRTPLNTILGMLQLLKEGTLSKEEQSLAEMAFRSSTNLLDIVNDILDLSRIEAGEMRLEILGIDLTYVLDSIVDAMGHLAKEKHLPLIRHKDKENLPYVLGDPTRIGRIFSNLIGNAIKFTDAGHVDIRSSFRKLDNSHIEFRCEITDTGIGIPKEKQNSIFKKFSQIDTSTTRKYGGTGLGLAITKWLLDLMRGTIGVESEVDVGSTFWFTIPFEVTDTFSIEKHRRKKKMIWGIIPPEKARILVAEDHPLNQMLIKKLLQRFGIGFFEVAENGVEVLKRTGEASWDVILMDCQMPEKSGYDATEEIRALERGTGLHVPIIAMTANAMVGDKEKCLRCGMDEYISKPINIDELKEVLGQWIAFQDLAEPAKDEPAPHNDNVPLDLSMLKSFSEGDTDMEKKFAGAYVVQSDINLKTLAENRATTGATAWRDAAHMFKGGSSGIGANALAELCKQAQHFEGAAQERAALFEKISSEYVRVKDHLKKIGLLS